MKVLKELYDLSLKDGVELVKNKMPKKGLTPPNYDFLTSEKYDELMRQKLPFPCEYDTHEAQNETQNYLFRHTKIDNQLGIFRWRGMQKHKDFLLKKLNNSDLKIVDFGGAACPVGFNATVVDYLPVDKWGQKVSYRNIEDIPHDLDMVFTSHTLEHVTNLEEVLQKIKDKLVAGGYFVVHIPSFYCERWRVGIHTNNKYNDHVWTFGLSGTPVPKGLEKYSEADTVIGKFFKIELSEFCGDDSIFMICRK